MNSGIPIVRHTLRRFPGGRAVVCRLMPWLIGLALAMCWDRAAYLHVRVGANSPTPETAASAAEWLEARAWYQLLYILGTVWPWLIVAAALVFADIGADAGRARRGVRRAVFLIVSVLLSGGAAELAKLACRRLRPEEADGWYRFRPWTEDFWSASNLGLPSSHAAVAFGAAFAMCRVFPRAASVFLAVGIGCSISRLLAGAHFLSDVFAGAGLAFFIVAGVYALDRRNNRGQGIDEIG